MTNTTFRSSLPSGLLRGILLGLAMLLTQAFAAQAETLRIRVPSDPGYLDPAYWGSTVDQILIDNLFPRLAKPVAGEEWQIELDAAASVDMTDLSRITFELKPGIMWTGGYGELTAEDVKYSYERHLDPALGSAIANEYEAFDHVEVTGKYTGIIHMKEPSVTFWTTTLSFTSGAIVSKAAAEASGGYFEATPAATAGAYMIDSFEPGNRLVLTRNPDWTGETGDFDEIVLLPISDGNAAELAFAAGEVDFLRSSIGNYENLRANPPREAVVEQVQSLDPMFLGITATNEKLADQRVRRAIQLAIDVPTILAATTNGMSPPATGLVAPGLIGHKTDATLTRDVEEARRLLAEAGAEGLSVRLDYINTTENDTAAQIMQGNLAEVGIMLELNGQDEGTFWNLDAAKAADLELHLKTWIGNPDSFYLFQYFVEEQIGVWNWEAFTDPDYDALLKQARVETDEEKRGTLYRQMQHLMEQSGSFLFISQDPYVVMYREGIEPGMLPDGRAIFDRFRKVD